MPLALLLMCNAIILSVWEGVSPPYWERTPIEINNFGQVISSEGSCTSDNGIGYISALIAVNGIALILACYQAFIGRDIKTELNESSYICMAMICIFQSCFFGVPLLFVSSSNQSALLYVGTSICFVICMATLLFIFVPKIITQRNRDAGTQQSRRTTVTGLSPNANELRVRGGGNGTMSNSLLQLRETQRACKRRESHPAVKSNAQGNGVESVEMIDSGRTTQEEDPIIVEHAAQAAFGKQNVDEPMECRRTVHFEDDKLISLELGGGAAGKPVDKMDVATDNLEAGVRLSCRNVEKGTATNKTLIPVA